MGEEPFYRTIGKNTWGDVAILNWYSLIYIVFN
jgi:hypothetical protein